MYTSLMAAKSTTAGTPVKSCIMTLRNYLFNIYINMLTLAGLKGISMSCWLVCYQFTMFQTSFWLILQSSQFLMALSKRTLTLNGKLSKGNLFLFFKLFFMYLTQFRVLQVRKGKVLVGFVAYLDFSLQTLKWVLGRSELLNHFVRKLVHFSF